MAPNGYSSSARVKEAVRTLVQKRTSDFPISIADIAERVRYAFGDFQMSDRELADLIAGEIIKAGGNVSFDSSSRQPVAVINANAGTPQNEARD